MPVERLSVLSWEQSNLCAALLVSGRVWGGSWGVLGVSGRARGAEGKRCFGKRFLEKDAKKMLLEIEHAPVDSTVYATFYSAIIKNKIS